ncbi:Membrane protein involved in the export of O-antigen, teichoic acid lipoteichoic acid [Indibacter alkaliphilus LW1]|uniref:Membrane protein involved in the export of O-antigen, teichoic acid lipoteichoic acid n=1 Tax=Indibacter alkaliphilus (strain CCUG 57479 / KCTC 22604 / LW1) TaxID=1189612 RepID=S2DW98_INDAL|nr:oligosaccharide flippase family protein [Indibacter alkaliphilus]EOZ96376.1 Membrane protein involved in the export of O-antigen, teichoic acid lipoteichoic acid [Indibacter alkaliphilus LW1]
MLKSILANKVFKNFSYLTLGTVLSQILSLITVLKITNILKPDDYGLYTFIIAQGALLVTIADLGIQTIIVRAISRDNDRTNDLVINGIYLRLIALILVSGIYILYNYFLGELDALELFYLFCFSLITCIGKLYEIVFIGFQRMLPTSVINFLFSFFWFAAVFILPSELMTVSSLMVIYLFINLLKNFTYYLVLRKLGMLIGKVSGFLESSTALIKESWPYFALTLVMLPYRRFANNFLDINSSIEEVGFYNLSEKFTGPISMVLDIGLIAIFPNLSSLWVSNREKFIKVVKTGFRYYMLLGGILAFLFTMFAHEILTILFPPEYLPAVIVCQIQIWFLLLSSIDSLVGTVLGATNNEKRIFQLGLVNSIISTPIIFYGSFYGAFGLSVAYLITFALFQFYIWYIFQKYVNINIDKKILTWGVLLSLFGLSYFLFSDFGVFLKIILSLFFLSVSVYLILGRKTFLSWRS